MSTIINHPPEPLGIFAKLTSFINNSLTNTDNIAAYLSAITAPSCSFKRFQKGTFKITHVSWISDNMYTIGLSSKHPGFKSFKAGQCIQLTVEKNGRLLQRFFSISSPPALYRQRGIIELSIRVQEDGEITPWLCHQEPGTLVQVSAPLGDFVLKHTRKQALFIAGGSGITPILSMLEAGKNEAWLSSCTLLYYLRSSNSIPFHAQLEALRAKGLNLHYLESTKLGRLRKQHLESYCANFLEHEVYLCGPPGMLVSGRELFSTLSLPTQHLHIEQFGQVAQPSANLTPDTEHEVSVHFRLSEHTSQVLTANPGSLLELAEAQDLSPTSGCRAGICHQCTCRKISGRVVNTKTGKVSDSGSEDIQLCISSPIDSITLEL